MSIIAESQAIIAIANTAKAELGIEIARYPVPPNLDTFKLPCLYVLTGAATYDRQRLGDDGVAVTRQYLIQVAVLPRDMATPTDRETRVPPIIDACREVFFRYATLNGTTGVEEAYPTGDSGVVLLPLWDAKYFGFEMTFEVVTLDDRCIVK